jgi:formamidopyrimidine-DNA glycosylase
VPELPEVETIRRMLRPRLIGADVTRTRLLRRDIAVAPGDPAGGFSRQRSGNGRVPARIRPADLLQGDRISAIDRRGKRLLIRAESGRALGVHLGMTGQLLILPPRQPLPQHTHAIWWLGLPGAGRLVFRDPRRFGGLWLFRDAPGADAWLDQLGPDALTITARQLGGALAGAYRPIKAALLDQSLLAGVGNIYADEALYRAHLLPQRSAAGLGREEVADLARAIRVVLREAVRSRGSTLRDYRDPEGRSGAAQLAHQVYGRAGAPCLRCRRPLTLTRVAQRATVVCASCQG